MVAVGVGVGVGVGLRIGTLIAMFVLVDITVGVLVLVLVLVFDLHRLRTPGLLPHMSSCLYRTCGARAFSFSASNRLGCGCGIGIVYLEVRYFICEDEAGIVGRENIAARLSKFCFVKVHVFEQSGTQPEHLTPEEVKQLFQ